MNNNINPNDLKRVSAHQLQKARELETRIYKNRIEFFVIKYGSFRAAAKALKIDHAYLYKLKNGTKRNPSDKILKKLGLKY